MEDTDIPEDRKERVYIYRGLYNTQYKSKLHLVLN